MTKHDDPGARPGARDATRYLRLHLWAYGLGIGFLVAVDLVALPGWWFFWPTLVWGCLLALHYFYVKSAYVDNDWAEERAADVRLRAYDVGHIDSIIDSIEDRYSDGSPPGSGKAETKDGRGTPGKNPPNKSKVTQAPCPDRD